MASSVGKATPLDSIQPIGGGNNVVVQEASDSDPSELISIQETLDSVATDADYAAHQRATEYRPPPSPPPVMAAEEDYVQYEGAHMQMRPIPVMFASETPLLDQQPVTAGPPSSTGASAAAGTLINTLTNLRATRLALLVGITFLVLHRLPPDVFAASFAPAALAAHPAFLLLARPGLAAVVVLVLANTVASLCT